MDHEQARAPCPPHHWLIGSENASEQWHCQRCGLVRRHESRPAEARRLANVSTWSRDEIALAESWQD